jgi:hypothetical protein
MMTNPSFEYLAHEFLQSAESVGNCDKHVDDAMVELESSIAESCQLAGFNAVWQVVQKANEVLKVILPEFGDVFAVGGDLSSSPPRPTVEITEEAARKIMIREVLRGMKMFDGDPNRQAGAVKMMAAIPSSIPRSSRPFEESEPRWDHTHASRDDRTEKGAK